VEPQNKRIYLNAAEGSARVDVEAFICDEELAPTASLTTLRQQIRPSESVMRPLFAEPRDIIWYK